jgi:hypothetical protein
MQDFPADRKEEQKKFDDKKKSMVKSSSVNTSDPAVETNKDIPQDLDIFFRTINDLLPAGKTWNDLTPEEQEILKNKYRFDPMKPSQYQLITGFGPMI